jgi:uncharacterized protein
MREIFINDVGRLRSGWRILIFCAAFVASGFLIATILRLLYLVLHDVGPVTPYFALVADMIFRIMTLAAGLGAGYLCARWLEGLPWRSLGLTFHQEWFRDLLVGCAIGFAALAMAVAIAAAAGGLRFSFGGASGALLWSLVGSALLLFVAALAEEALFRGYVLQTLTRAQLAWLGVLVTSVPFGLVHLSNPNVVPVVTFANTALAGIWFGVAYLRTRSLWFPVGLHWAWNWALGPIFGLPISGRDVVSNTLLRGDDLGPAWLTGGSYGIEGGLACTVAMTAFTIITWRIPWVSATPEMQKLTSEENPALPAPVLTIRPADEAL